MLLTLDGHGGRLNYIDSILLAQSGLISNQSMKQRDDLAVTDASINSLDS
jgi:hypothetical protein